MAQAVINYLAYNRKAYEMKIRYPTVISLLLTIVMVLLLFPFRKGQIQYVNILDKKVTLSIKGKEMGRSDLLIERSDGIFVKYKTIYYSVILLTWVEDEPWEAKDLILLEKLARCHMHDNQPQ